MGKKCLDISGIDGPLGQLGGVGDSLGGAVSKCKEALAFIEEFIKDASSKLMQCFQVPAPLCFVTPCALQQAPQPLQDMLALVDKLKEVDLSALVNMLANTQDTLGQIDVARVT